MTKFHESDSRNQYDFSVSNPMIPKRRNITNPIFVTAHHRNFQESIHRSMIQSLPRSTWADPSILLRYQNLFHDYLSIIFLSFDDPLVLYQILAAAFTVFSHKPIVNIQFPANFLRHSCEFLHFWTARLWHPSKSRSLPKFTPGKWMNSTNCGATKS